MVALAANTLQTLDSVAARLRAELNAVASWRPKGSLELLHLDEQTANYIAAPVPHFTNNPAARLSNEAWTHGWEHAFEELIAGNIDYEFLANSLPGD
jgi:hypothetical protein